MAYGAQIFDTNGSTTVLSEPTRYLNRITDNVTITGVASHTFNIDATGLSSANCAVIVTGTNPNSAWSTAFNGASGITITSTFGATLSGTFFVARF